MEAIFNQLESTVSESFGWPLWVTRTIIVLCTFVGIFGSTQLSSINVFASPAKVANIDNLWKFRKFQASYLVVYLLIMLADWLQGTNMYTLYSVGIMQYYYIF